eukprot:SAG11_NODE_11977_length_728_cov_0.899841_1_plen_115_part_00
MDKCDLLPSMQSEDGFKNLQKAHASKLKQLAIANTERSKRQRFVGVRRKQWVPTEGGMEILSPQSTERLGLGGLTVPSRGGEGDQSSAEEEEEEVREEVEEEVEEDEMEDETEG